MSFGFSCCCNCCNPDVTEFEFQVPGSFSDGVCKGYEIFSQLNALKVGIGFIINPLPFTYCSVDLGLYINGINNANIACSEEAEIIKDKLTEYNTYPNEIDNLNFVGGLLVNISAQIVTVPSLPFSIDVADVSIWGTGQYPPTTIPNPKKYNFQKTGCALVIFGGINSIEVTAITLDWAEGVPAVNSATIKTGYNNGLWVLEGLNTADLIPGKQFKIPNKILTGSECNPNFTIGVAYTDVNVNAQQTVLAGPFNYPIGSAQWNNGDATFNLL